MLSTSGDLVTHLLEFLFSTLTPVPIRRRFVLAFLRQLAAVLNGSRRRISPAVVWLSHGPPPPLLVLAPEPGPAST